MYIDGGLDFSASYSDDSCIEYVYTDHHHRPDRGGERERGRKRERSSRVELPAAMTWFDEHALLPGGHQRLSALSVLQLQL